MVEVGGGYGEVDEGGAGDGVFEGLEGSPVDGFLAAAEEGVFAAAEVPVDAGYVGADDFDVANVAAAESHFVRHPDELDAHWIEAHHLGGYGVDGDLIGAREDDVLGVPAHGAGAGSVAGECAVGYGEDAGVNLLLYLQEVNEGLVDGGVCPVAVVV